MNQITKFFLEGECPTLIDPSQPALTCSKSTIKTLGHVVKSAQSKQ